jgi:hypothetical protein
VNEFEPHEVENIYPQCEFVFTDEPGVYRCRRCDFKTRKLNWPPEKVHRQCTVPDAPERKLPCAHRGERLGDETCETCEGNWRIKTFACPLHVRCTTLKKLPGITCCKHCRQYVAEIPIADPPASE